MEARPEEEAREGLPALLWCKAIEVLILRHFSSCCAWLGSCGISGGIRRGGREAEEQEEEEEER